MQNHRSHFELLLKFTSSIFFSSFARSGKFIRLFFWMSSCKTLWFSTFVEFCWMILQYWNVDQIIQCITSDGIQTISLSDDDIEIKYSCNSIVWCNHFHVWCKLFVRYRIPKQSLLHLFGITSIVHTIWEISDNFDSTIFTWLIVEIDTNVIVFIYIVWKMFCKISYKICFFFHLTIKIILLFDEKNGGRMMIITGCCRVQLNFFVWLTTVALFSYLSSSRTSKGTI